jgi:putative oxidoreductase
MKRSGAIILKIVIASLVLLWSYTASVKLLNINEFRQQMLKQALPMWLNKSLVWMLPSVEVLTTALLLLKRLQHLGLLVSFMLMLLFSGYVGLVVAGYYKRIPCSCGGVLQSMSWNINLGFNLFFLLLTYIGIFLSNRERRLKGSAV